MKKSPLMLVLLAAACLAGAAVWMLTRDPAPEHAGSALQRAPDVDPERPGLHVPEGKHLPATAKPARIESLPAVVDAPAVQEAKPAGPVRRISGRVVRLSDGSPLAGALVARVTGAHDGTESGDAESASGVDGAGKARTAETARASDTSSAAIAAPVIHATGGSNTHEDGSFTLTDVPLAEHELSVALLDGWPRTPATYPLPDVPGDIDGLALTCDSGFLLRGTVTDLGNAPIAGATAGVGAHTVTTDDAGRFELRDVTPGAKRLSIDAWAEAPWHVRDTHAVNPPADSTLVATVAFQLAGSGAIEGRITDPQGKPVAGAKVHVAAKISSSHAETADAHLETASDSDGRYRLDHVPEGRYLVTVGTDAFAQAAEKADGSAYGIAVAQIYSAEEVPHAHGEAGAFAPRWFPGIDVKNGQATRLDVELDHGAVIEGRVTDASGARLAGAKVTLERLLRWPAPDQSGSSISYDGTNTITSRAGADGKPGETEFASAERSAVTGEDGTYRFEVVTAGEKRLTAIDGKQLCAPRKSELTVQATELHEAVDFALDFGLTLRGRVTDPGGAPIEGVSAVAKPEGTQVFTNDGAVKTGADGWFEILGLTAGKHALMLTRSGYAYRYESVLPGDVPRTWILTPSPKVHGLVTDAVTGAPVLRFSLTIALPQSTMTSGDGDHPEGRFHADVDDDTPCNITIEATGYEPERKENVVPTSTAGAPLEFRLKSKA